MLDVCFAVFCRTRPERVAEVPRGQEGRRGHPVLSALAPHGRKCRTLSLSAGALVPNAELHHVV